jgi:ABC-type Fe3+/spermidine/putrescine transport system ATPase subunit
MSGGKVEQYADARGLYREPATMFVADFVGTMNVYAGTLAPGGVVVPCDELSTGASGDYDVGVRPEDVQVSPDGDGAEAEIVREVPRGHFKELVLRAGPNEIRAFVPAELATVDRARIGFARALLPRAGALQRAGAPALI